MKSPWFFSVFARSGVIVSAWCSAHVGARVVLCECLTLVPALPTFVFRSSFRNMKS